MRLLIVMPSRGRGGAEEYCLRIAPAALEQGWKVHVALPRMSGTESLIEDFRKLGANCQSLEVPEDYYVRMEEETELLHKASRNRSSRSLRWLHSAERNLHRAMEAKDTVRQFIRTTSLLLRIRSDVVLVNLPWPTLGLGILVACGFMRRPTAVVFHTSPFPFWIRPSKVKAYNWARLHNQKWITVSDSSRKFMCGIFHLNHDDITLIYNGVRVAPESNEHEPNGNRVLRDEVRRELGIPNDARILLTIARLQVGKGYDYLIPTIPHIVKEFPDVRFVWVGGGDQKELLAQKMQEYGITERIMMLGFRPDIPRLMRAADLFVFPTYYEGLPLTLLEAMGDALPIVSASAGGIPEVIQGGVHGLLSRPGDSSDLLEAIRWALRHPDEMREMGRKAKVRAREFSEDKMLQQTLEVLQDLGHARSSRNSSRQ
jgi:glycosyltransferase involved in cell wall biosynthesis